MKDVISDVSMFHEVFGLPIADRPMLVDRDTRELRLNLLDEEYCEYRRAAQSNDLVEIADALADMIYIIAGTALIYGIPLEEVWDAVQVSNISKAGSCEFCEGYGVDEDNQPCDTCGGNGFRVIRRMDGKILKPEGWQPPNIKAILDRTRDRG